MNNLAGTFLGFVLLILGYVLVCLPIIGGILYAFYFLLTLPMRRNERARIFLDLLELGLKNGNTPEFAIVDAASSRDRSIGVRFHLLAAHLETGLRLGEALKRVPHLLPSQVRAMLQAGERIGDLAKVLPACRLLLRDGVSQVRGALNYLVLLAFCVTPVTVIVPIYIAVKVIPKFKEIFAGMGNMAMPAFSRLVLGSGPTFLCVQVMFLVLLWLALIAYIGGPRLREWLGRILPGLPDWLLQHLPWRKKRLQRDFSAMLSVLLDAEVPETEAVKLAAESTANALTTRRAEMVRSQLAAGIKLPEALRALDDSGELQWRLANALQRRGGFLRALTGWLEALDAKAFQLEQTAAQTATTALVLINGAFVASIVIGVFLMLINLINQALLW